MKVDVLYCLECIWFDLMECCNCNVEIVVNKFSTSNLVKERYFCIIFRGHKAEAMHLCFMTLLVLLL